MGISTEVILSRVKSQLDAVFSETIEKYVFLNTPFVQLQSIISNREMSVRNEYVIVKCVVMWVLYDVEDRLRHATSLFELVDCGMCSKSMMLENRSINTHVPLLDKLVQQLHIKISILNDNCTKGLIKQYGVDRINTIEVPGSIKSSSKSLCHVSKDGIYNTATKERLVQYNFGEVDNLIYTTKELLFIFSFSESKMYKYNIVTNEVDLCSYPTDSYFGSSSSVNETSDSRLVVIGGYSINWELCSNEVRYYDVTNDSWSKGQSLPYDVSDHATVIDGDDMYVIGGVNSNKTIRYRDCAWQTLSPLINNRHTHIAVLNNNCIYIFGGNRHDIEYYNMSTDQWSVIDIEVYKSTKSYNSVININECLLYTHEDDNVYSISLDSKSKLLLYTNISCRRLVIMPL